MLFLVKKFPGEKGHVRRWVVVMQQPVLLKPKFGAKSSRIFSQSPQNVTAICGIYYLAWQDEFFAKSPLYAKENNERAFDFDLHLLRLFPVSVRLHFPLV
jgi:hypothetical protein